MDDLVGSLASFGNQLVLKANRIVLRQIQPFRMRTLPAEFLRLNRDLVQEGHDDIIPVLRAEDC